MVARGCQGSPEVPVGLKRGLQTVPGPGGAANGQIRRNRGSPPPPGSSSFETFHWADVQNPIILPTTSEKRVFSTVRSYIERDSVSRSARLRLASAVVILLLLATRGAASWGGVRAVATANQHTSQTTASLRSIIMPVSSTASTRFRSDLSCHSFLCASAS